jgi:DNA end-binding protein Ku
VEPPDFDAPGAASALDAENIALESTRTIDIDELVPKSDIDELDLVRSWYIVPKGKVGTAYTCAKPPSTNSSVPVM